MIGGQIQDTGDGMLHFSRVLSRAINMHTPVFFWHSVCDLSFQIKVLLSADVELPLKPARRGGQFCSGPAAFEAHGRHDMGLPLFRLPRSQYSG